MSGSLNGNGAAAPPLSPVRACYVGRSHAGSWIVRGEQMSAQRRNWKATHKVTEEDLADFDIFCFVKRTNPDLQEHLLANGKVLVFDVVDTWAQPDDHAKASNAREARDLFEKKWRGLPPFHAHIFANRAMYLDLVPLTKSATYIYHHANPSLQRNPLRPVATTVGYEGNEAYLGTWRDAIEAVCGRLGLRFVVNPADYAEIDIGFAAREGVYSGYLPNTYKSNVKLANFIATGTPCIVNSDEVSYHETDCGGVRFFADSAQLEHQLGGLMDLDTRRRIQESFLAAAPVFDIGHIAAIYEHFFSQLLRRVRG